MRNRGTTQDDYKQDSWRIFTPRHAPQADLEGNLDLPDMEVGTYIPEIDPKMQWTINGEHHRRQRVISNLPGTQAFCPLVFCTPGIEQVIDMDLKIKPGK